MDWAPVPAPAAAAPPRRWVLPVAWTLVVTLVIVESLWLSLAFDEQTWQDEGIEPSGAAIGVLVALDILVRLAIGLLVAADARRLHAGDLRLAFLPTTGAERTSPTAWGWLAGIFCLPTAVLYSMARRHIRAFGEKAGAAARAPDKKALKAWLKDKAGAQAPGLAAMRKREAMQSLGFFLTWILSSFLARL